MCNLGQTSNTVTVTVIAMRPSVGEAARILQEDALTAPFPPQFDAIAPVVQKYTHIAGSIFQAYNDLKSGKRSVLVVRVAPSRSTQRRGGTTST